MHSSKISYRYKVLGILGLWFILALTVSSSGLLQKIPRPAVQGILAGLTLLLFLCFLNAPGFRSWIYQLNFRWLLSIHFCRFVGFYFLWLYSRRELPFEFAVPGGCGDTLIALGAVVLCGTQLGPVFLRRLLWIWNTLGFIDILFVVITAARLGIQDPSSMKALTYLPLSLLPTFFVPLIFFSHGIVARALWRDSAYPSSPQRSK
jgi:hypothetical protein